ncbi:hypothetical protein GCM10017778_40040 [Streptomyces vinaceus]|nr:hypothetical protein GCM10017778_40040 [Streptomyces vinaceus]
MTRQGAATQMTAPCTGGNSVLRAGGTEWAMGRLVWAVCAPACFAGRRRGRARAALQLNAPAPARVTGPGGGCARTGPCR